MKKIILIVTLLILVTVGTGIYITKYSAEKYPTPSLDLQQKPNEQFTKQVSTDITEDRTPINPVSSAKEPLPVLERSPYVDSVNKFSLRVPRTWIASTTDDGLTVFSDPLTKNDPGQAELKVGVIVRDNDANETIASLGQDEFTNQIIGTLTEDRNGVEVISTKKVMINGTLYYQATVTYLSANNNARVKILVNITYTTDAIIMLAAEAYTDEWDLNKDAIMESMGTFRIN